MINITIDPITSGITKEQFLDTAPDYSIALDGYVACEPFFDSKRKLQNFNHHQNVGRLQTRCTSAQVLMAIRMGLFETYNKQGSDFANVFVNDCDEDVCLSLFLLKNKNLVINTVNPLINKIVHLEDMLDSSSGTYPFPSDLESLSELAWVFQPYRMFRTNGGLDHKSVDDYQSIISDVEHRIMKYITGHSQKLKIEGQYEVLIKTDKYSVIKETSPLGRLQAFADGIKAYVIQSVRSDSTYNYVLGRISEYIDFDLELLTQTLNRIDLEYTPSDCWGGGNLIMGSPRVRGSKYSAKALREIIDSTLYEA